MHAPPAVSYPVGPGRWLGWGFGALSATCLGLLALWCYQINSTSILSVLPHALMFAAWALASALAWRAWRRWPVGRVRWSGQTWGWELPASEVQGVVAVALDLQSCLLLRWEPLWPEGGGAYRLQAVWLWAQASSSPADWLAFRRAVFARQGLVADLGSPALKSRNAVPSAVLGSAP